LDDKLSRVIQIVEKLLVYDENNSTPGEFEAAQSKAQALITKYQLEESQLSSGSNGRDIIARRFEMPGSYMIDKVVLLSAVAKHNFCKVLKGRGYAMIYGYESDVELTIGLYQMLSVSMVSQMLKEYEQLEQKPDNVTGWKKSFFGGYIVGVDERLLEAKIESVPYSGDEYGLVLRDKQHSIEEFWDKLAKGEPSTRLLTSTSGYGSGLASGLKADIGQTRLRSTPQLNR